MMPYGVLELDQHWFETNIGSEHWRNQAITWTNVDLSSVRWPSSEQNVLNPKN